MRIHGHGKEHGFRVFRIIGLVITGIFFAVAFALIFGIVVQAAWNWLMPELFGLKTVTFWQAFVLVILAKILFGGFHGRHGNRYDRFQNKMWLKGLFSRGGISPRAYRKYYSDFWEKEGREAFEQYVKRMEESAGGTKRE